MIQTDGHANVTGTPANNNEDRAPVAPECVNAKNPSKNDDKGEANMLNAIRPAIDTDGVDGFIVQKREHRPKNRDARHLR